MRSGVKDIKECIRMFDHKPLVSIDEEKVVLQKEIRWSSVNRAFQDWELSMHNDPMSESDLLYSSMSLVWSWFYLWL